MTFKIGDKVKVIKQSSGYFKNGDILTIRDIINGFLYFNGITGGWFSNRFDKALDPLIEAKLLLEKNGFTVTDPPKPRTRDVVAYYFYGHPETIHFAELNYFVNKRDWASPPIRIGGTFQWTEELKL